MVETPGSCMVTPYTASAACMVRGLWVMTMNCVRSLNSASRRTYRPTLASSSGASTSSSRQKRLVLVGEAHVAFATAKQRLEHRAKILAHLAERLEEQRLGRLIDLPRRLLERLACGHE